MNAVLNIQNTKRFAYDIWQYEARWEDKQWKEAMVSFAETITHAKEVLEKLAENEVQDEFLDDELYILGDAINFFNSIDVKTEGRQRYVNTFICRNN